MNLGDSDSRVWDGSLSLFLTSSLGDFEDIILNAKQRYRQLEKWGWREDEKFKMRHRNLAVVRY